MKSQLHTLAVVYLTLLWAPFGFSEVKLSETQINKIGEAAKTSEIKRHKWMDFEGSPGGRMIPEYAHGMGLMYAQYSLMLRDDAADKYLQAVTALVVDNETDAIWKYGEIFRALELDVIASRQDVLKAVFLVLLELGERESDGGYDIGYDLGGNKPGKEKERLRKYLENPDSLSKAEKKKVAETSEAGLFQASWNFRKSETLCSKLLTEYESNSSRSDIFPFSSHFRRAGEFYGKKSSDKKAVGLGDGVIFQQLAKDKPAFAVEYTALTLRTKGTDYYHFILQDKMELGSEMGVEVGEKGLAFIEAIEAIIASSE